LSGTGAKYSALLWPIDARLLRDAERKDGTRDAPLFGER
jgi:hypothetical protein